MRKEKEIHMNFDFNKYSNISLLTCAVCWLMRFNDNVKRYLSASQTVGPVLRTQAEQRLLLGGETSVCRAVFIIISPLMLTGRLTGGAREPR